VAKVLPEMSVSMDGYVTGPDVSPEEPMGGGGRAAARFDVRGPFLGRVREVRDRSLQRHRGPRSSVVAWRTSASARGARSQPSTPRSSWSRTVPLRPSKAGATSYEFVTRGIDDALRQAHKAAGPAYVLVNGGAEIARQYLRASAVDELRLHLVPVILDAGTRLVDDEPSPSVCLRPIAVTSTPRATHLTYEVEHSAANAR
jgi:riboflavin biosynthesis pyrimidine reductase